MRGLCVAALTAALVVGATACTADQPAADPSSPSNSDSASGSVSPSPTTTPTEPSPTNPGSGPIEAKMDLLDWESVPGPIDDLVTRAGSWTLTVNQQRSKATLDGPNPLVFDAAKRSRISDALIDGEYVLLVSQDTLEEDPATATIIELDTGRHTTIDGDSEVPTVNGGTWALGAGRVVHPTVDGGGYCLAQHTLATARSEVGWCAEDRHGFNHAIISDYAIALLTFDDAQPSCRTIVALRQGEAVPLEATPFEGVTECKGWDGATLPDGQEIWSVVPKESRIDAGHFFAEGPSGNVDLGPGTSGSLTVCGAAAYFTRDPQREGDPAQLLSWTGEELTVVYESPSGGEAFITTPLRCGGDELTLTLLSEAGDEQVVATLE
jgi:hypothetical protein